MEIRHYEALDEAIAIALWNDCLLYDQLNRENFYRRVIYDLNFDPQNYLLAFVDGDAAGFIYCTRRIVYDEICGLEPDKGWIVAMGVHPDFRRQGIGRALLNRVETAFSRAGVARIEVGAYSNNYICPGVDKTAYKSGTKFLEAMGYVNRGECCSMKMELHDYTYPAKYAEKKKALEVQGYIVKPYDAMDAVGIFRFMRESFPAWLPIARQSILHGKAEERMLIAKNPSGDVVGYAMRGMDGTDERFGPFGIKPSLQGIGLGSLLFNEMMLSMLRRRIFHCYFLWTSGRNPDIYATWGMDIYRTYLSMDKAL